MTQRKYQGFTIVELLVVIVVIAVLAAITIVAYNGIQQRATVASLSSDLENAAKRLKLDQVDLAAFPTTTATANSGNGLKASPGTSYQYSFNNGVSPQTFCLTATKGTTSYYINQDGVPQSGGCTGHIVGGAAITNLATNPSLESSATDWTPSNAANISVLRTQVGGKWVLQAQRLTTAAAAVRISYNTPIAVTNGGTYTVSASVTSTVNQNLRIDVRPPGSTVPTYSNIYAVTAGVPQRIYTTGVVTNATVYLAVLVDPAGSVGDTVNIDEVMFTSESNVYNYADGNSSGWSWNGTLNESPSTGPAL
jgi:prepilin-type N-terminal cleavage/methylation domain-containing protein